jgi:hypothetical protein
MPVWPKAFYTLRASVLTARTASRLRAKNRAVAEQAAAFEELTDNLGATAYWAQAGIEPEMDYETFRTRVAPRTLDTLAPEIARMKRGEADVLWPGACAFFATTAGTTGSAARDVPVTEDMLGHFRAATRDVLLYYTARVGHAGVFRGRHLLLGGTTALAALPEANGHAAFTGNLGGIALLNLPRWAERHLYEPGAAIAQLAEWDAKIAAIAQRAGTQDISLLAGIPPWVITLVAKLRKQHAAAAANLQALWPNLECYVHGGVPVGPYQNELRAALGPTVNFHEVYVAAEGCLAAQDGEPAAGLRLITNRGIFFEFIPRAEFDETRLEQMGARAVPLAGVKPNVDYVPLLTTPAGLARHVLGDVVRFVSTEPPRIAYVGRTALQLGAFGERVNEKEITDALRAICERNAWSIVNFHVNPIFSNNLTGTNRGRHEWWIELRPGTVATPTGPVMARELDAELQRMCPDYTAKRRSGAMEPPFVRLVMPGVFEHWLRFHQRWGGPNKMPRCRSDRLVADELAQMTNFARD